MSSQLFLGAVFSAALALPACASGNDGPLPDVKAKVSNFVNCKKPAYPAESLRKEDQGAVTLGFLIGADGTVKDSRIEKSSGFPLLDNAALAAWRKCTFSAGSFEGKSVESWMKLIYVWKLEDRSDEQMIADMQADAAKGDAKAAFHLSVFYLRGKGIERNPAESARLLELSASKGYAQAQESMGIMLLTGTGGVIDVTKAVSWLELAAAQGQARAQTMLGMLLFRGEGVARDQKAGLDWLRRSAQQGDPVPQSLLGRLLVEVAGDVGDVTEAVNWLTRASAQGNEAAKAALAALRKSGRTVP